MCDTETIFNGRAGGLAFGEVEDCIDPLRQARKSADADNRGKKR
jgi:hypothetical protein